MASMNVSIGAFNSWNVGRSSPSSHQSTMILMICDEIIETPLSTGAAALSSPFRIAGGMRRSSMWAVDVSNVFASRIVVSALQSGQENSPP